jgi:hypothetical protein
VTQWDRPGGAVNIVQHQAAPSLPENWEEAIDKSTGFIFFCINSIFVRAKSGTVLCF